MTTSLTIFQLYRRKTSSPQPFSWNIQEHEVNMETRGRGWSATFNELDPEEIDNIVYCYS